LKKNRGIEMKSFKELLHRKQEEPENQEEAPIISLKDLAKLEDTPEEAIIQAIEREPRLSERRESLSRYLQKMEIKPLEVVEEKIVRKQKLNKILVLMTQEIHAREQRQIQAQYEQEKHGRKEIIAKVLPNVRYCTKDVSLLMSGVLSLDVMTWKIPESTKINVAEKEFDLNTIDSRKWREMIQFKFHPIFIRLQKNAMRHGKPIGHWRHGEETYTENKAIEIGAEIILAVMVV